MTTHSLRHSFLLLLGVLLSITQSVHATWQTPILHYTPAQYAAGMQNWQLAQHSSGWVYAANNFGLLEYDGDDWQLYGVWNSTDVRALLVDDSCIYVGETNDFGVFAPMPNGELRYQPMTGALAENERQFGEIWSISKIDDVLYFQARHHIFRYSADGEIFVVYSEPRIYTCVAHDGALFAATSEGLAVLSGTKLVTLHGSDQLRGTEIRSLSVLGEDRLLIGTDFKGLYVLENNEVRRFPTDADAFICGNHLYTCAVSNGRIAIGTVLNGVVIMDEQGHNCQYISRQDGLQNNTVLSLMFDRSGNLWTGLDQGIDCILLSSSKMQLVDAYGKLGAGYAAMAYHGDLYLGTNQGLYRLRHFNPDAPMLDAGGALELIEGSLGQVWSLAVVDGQLLCCHNRGLYRLEGNRLRAICEEEGFWRVQPLGQDTWIAGTYKGFYLLRNGVCQRLTGIDDTALQFIQHAQDSLWLYTLHGVQLVRLDLEHDAAYGECVDPAQWADKIDDPFEKAFLLGRPRYGFVKSDEQGNIWYGADDAVYVRYTDGHSRQIVGHYGAVPGFENIYPLGNGYAIAGGIYGFSLLSSRYSERDSTSCVPDRVYLRYMRTVAPMDSLIMGESLVRTSVEPLLAAGDYTIEFLLGTAFQDGEPVQYSSYLEPIEKSYTIWDERNRRIYHAHTPGTYTLHVCAKVGDRLLDERAWTFRIRQPWYWTIWAKIVYLLLFMGMLYAAVRHVKQRMLEAQRQFEQEKMTELQASKMRILELENEKNQMELQSKSQELSNLLLEQVNKTELAADVMSDLRRIADDLNRSKLSEAQQRLRSLQERLAKNSEPDNDWKRFEENFDVVNASFLKNLMQHYPWMTRNEKKLCVYIKMGLLTKEIAPLMGLSTRGVEMLRYRMRQKMEIDAQVNLKLFFENME